MDHLEGTFLGADGTELYYQCWQPDSTPKAALAVVHGFGEHSGRYGNVVDWFVPRGYSLYAMDQRGHGRSPGKRGHIPSYALSRDDLCAFLTLVRQSKPDLPVFLIGHSQGGLNVLNYVLHDPSGLAGVIASGPLLCPPAVPKLLVVISKLLSRIMPSLTISSGIDASAISRDQRVVDAYVSDPLVHGQATPRTGMELLATIEWTQAHAAELALPCLIVHGAIDGLCEPEASKTFFENVAIADKERYEYEGYYHEIFNEPGKEKVFQDIEGWIERHIH